MNQPRVFTQRVFFSLCCMAAIVVGAAKAQATPATYTLTHSKVSGTIGGTSFTDSVLEVQYTLGDTGLLTDLRGGAPANGGVVRSPTFTGDQLAFTLTGGGLSSPVSGTFTSGDQFQVAASTSVNTGKLKVMNPSLQPYFSFQVPGTVLTPIPTLDRLTQSVSYAVNQPGNLGWGNDTQDPPASGNYVGGAAIENGFTFATTAGTLAMPQAQTRYNGSWTTTVAVPEPAALHLALVAAGGLLIAQARQRRRRSLVAGHRSVARSSEKSERVG